MASLDWPCPSETIFNTWPEILEYSRLFIAVKAGHLAEAKSIATKRAKNLWAWLDEHHAWIPVETITQKIDQMLGYETIVEVLETSLQGRSSNSISSNV